MKEKTKNVENILKQNQATYEAFKSALLALNSNQAFVGRVGLTVILKTDRIPSIVSDSLMDLMQASLRAINGAGIISPLSYAMGDESILVWDFSAISMGVGSKKFPSIEEFRVLVQSVPELSGEYKSHIEAVISKLESAAAEFFTQHAEVIMDKIADGDDMEGTGIIDAEMTRNDRIIH